MIERAVGIVVAVCLVYPVGRDVRADEQQSLAAYDTNITSISVSPDGKTIAVADRDQRFRGTLRLWYLSGQQRRAVTHVPRGYVKDAVFSPDGQLIAYVDDANQVAVDDVAGGTPRMRLKFDRDRMVSVLTFSGDGRSLLLGYQDKVLRVDIATGKNTTVPGLMRDSEFESNFPVQLSMSPNERWMAIARLDHSGSRLSVHDTKTDELLDLRQRGVNAVQFLANSNAIVYTSGEWTAGAYITFLNPEIESGTPPFEIFERGAIHSLDCSPDGKLIAICGSVVPNREGKRQSDTRIVVFDLAQRKVVASAAGLSRRCENIAFSVDGLHVIGPGKEHSIKVWETVELLNMTD